MESCVPEIVPQQEPYSLGTLRCPPAPAGPLKKRSLKLQSPKKVLGKSLKSKAIKKQSVKFMKMANDTSGGADSKLEAEGLPKIFACEHCSKSFLRSQQLGGHQSKAHPGQSQKYNEKLQTRNSRQLERITLNEAKKEFEEQYKKPANSNRALVNQIKKKLLEAKKCGQSKTI